MAAQSTIEIQRASKYTDRVRAYKVHVDGKEVGTIKNGETAEFQVAPGTHEVKLTIDWTSSPPLTIDAPPGGAVRLTCAPRANPFTALWFATVGKNRYLKLEPAT
jgi:hypothetical protein